VKRPRFFYLWVLIMALLTILAIAYFYSPGDPPPGRTGNDLSPVDVKVTNGPVD